MDAASNPAKRKQPHEPEARQHQTNVKRQRQDAPDDFEAETEDVEQDNLQFFMQPQVKSALMDEVAMLQIPDTFEDVDSDSADEQQMDFPEAHTTSPRAEEQSKQPQIEVIDVDALESLPSPRRPIKPPQPKPLPPPYRPIAWVAKEADANEHPDSTSQSEGLTDSDEQIQIRSWLHPSEQQEQGSLWSVVRQHQFKSLLTDPRFVLRSAQVERDDFLKAHMRLQHFAHPRRLSDLLGPTSRPREYCQFILDFMLDLNNSKQVTVKTPRRRYYVKHPSINVHEDGEYADNDPIVKRIDLLKSQKEQQKQGAADESQKSERSGDTYQEELVHLSEVRPADESDEEEPEVITHKSQRLQLQDNEMDQLCDFASYVVRSYMLNVSGETFYSVDEFAKYSQQHGISFLDSDQSAAEHQFDRLKWLNEPVLAPTLGKAKIAKEPLQLWHHAMNTFSVKNLARCALIQTDPLLDWLEYVTRFKNNPTTVEEFFTSERPVVCFAPVALLYLADAAVAFALDVLRAATHFVEADELSEEEEEAKEEDADEEDEDGKETKPIENKEIPRDLSTLIERMHIRRAASRKLMNILPASSIFLNHNGQPDLLPDGSVHPPGFKTEWPQRKLRPYTQSTEFELCSRSPAVKVTVPDVVMTETRVVLMGIKSIYHLDLYTKGSISTGVPKRLQKSLSTEEKKRYMKEGKESYLSISKRLNTDNGAKCKNGLGVKPKLGAHGDMQMKDVLPDSVGSISVKKEGSVVRTSRPMDLIPKKEAKGVSQQAKDAKVRDVQAAENLVNTNVNGQAKERGSEPHFKVDVPAKQNESVKSNQTDVKLEGKVLNSSPENVHKTSSEEAAGKTVDAVREDERSKAKKIGECASGMKTDGDVVKMETRVNNLHEIKDAAALEEAKNADEGVMKDTTLNQVKTENEIITKATTSEQEILRQKKYAAFFGIPNPAEVILATVGIQESRKMDRKDFRAALAKMNGESPTEDSRESTEANEGRGDMLPHRAASICYNRLRWIVFHALGVNVEEELSAERPLGYASTANYANFRQFRSEKPLAISEGAFFLLAQLTEQYVRHEAEILMDCAAHDDGRPWIDRADVALVHAVRKKDFPYNIL